MPLAFTIEPTRFVRAVDGTSWTVLMRRGSAWPGWRWLDWVERNVQEPGSPFLWPVYALVGLDCASRWVVYRVSRRSDWTVLVNAGTAPDFRPGRAVHLRRCSSRAAAALLAEDLCAHLRQGWVPRAG